MPFKKTSSTPSFGTPAESDDITGDIGWSGLAELQDFVDAGGLLITLGSGSMLPLEGGMVRGVRREAGGVPRRDRKSTRLNSSHSQISYAVFSLKKKKTPRSCASSHRT